MTSPVLISSTPLATSVPGAEAWHIRYRSHDQRGREHEVTGIVFAPRDRGTDAPIVTWCHGTTGIGDVACPSAQPDPARELTVYFSPDATTQLDYGVPGIAGLIEDGYVVCATDYQGLGTPGIHQYNVNRTNGLDALYAAHAAREMGIGAGTRLIGMGWSQGGGAAAGLAELDDADFADLDLRGCVLMSPAVTIIGLEDPIGVAASLAGGTAPPDSHVLMLLMGHSAGFDLDLGDLLTPLGVDIMTSVQEIQPVHHINDTVARMFRLKGPILRNPPANVDAWKAAANEGSAGRIQPRCPMLVCIDSFDGGTVVPVQWQQGYIKAAQALGGQVESRDYPKDDHFSLPFSCSADARGWVRAQFT